MSQTIKKIKLFLKKLYSVSVRLCWQDYTVSKTVGIAYTKDRRCANSQIGLRRGAMPTAAIDYTNGYCAIRWGLSAVGVARHSCSDGLPEFGGEHGDGEPWTITVRTNESNAGKERKPYDNETPSRIPSVLIWTQQVS
jgi:hypothetical protein